MNKYKRYMLTGFAYLLYLVSAATFVSYVYSFTIKDTVSAIESAFGTLVILVFLLVLAKKSKEAANAGDNPEDQPENTDSGA